MNASVHWPQNA